MSEVDPFASDDDNDPEWTAYSKINKALQTYLWNQNAERNRLLEETDPNV